MTYCHVACLQVDTLAQRIESLQPRAPQSAGQSSECNFPATSTDCLTAFNVSSDYHDGPKTSSGFPGTHGDSPTEERARGLSERPGGKVGNVSSDEGGKNVDREPKKQGGGWKASVETGGRDERKNGGFLGETGYLEPPKVDSLAIWGELQISGIPDADGRPSLELVDAFPGSGSFSLGPSAAGRASLMRTSSEGDATLWNRSGVMDDTASKGVTSPSPGYSEPKETQAVEESVRNPSPELHGTLYSPLDDESVWESILSGPPKSVVGTDPTSLELEESPTITGTLAQLRGHLDRRMFEVGKSNGIVKSEEARGTGSGKGNEGERRPSQMPYVTLPNTPLHEGAGLRSQLSRTDSGASSDFQ